MSMLKVNQIIPFNDFGIGVGGVNADPSSIFSFVSVTQGILFPRMTTSQRDAIAIPTDGLTIYNITTHAVEHYSSATSSWESTDGIQSINGQSAKLQLLTIGSAGFSPNWTQTGTNTNILNIPQASTTAVASGLISNGDYNYFAQKLNPVKNVLRVIKNSILGPQDYNTISDALAAITTNSISNPFVILVGPGVFSEPPLVMKPYVRIQGSGDEETVIQATNPNAHLIEAVDFSLISSCTLTGATGSGYAAIHVATNSLTTNTAFWAEEIRFGNNDTQILAEGTTGNSSILINACKIGGMFAFNRGFVTNSTGGATAKITVRNTTTTALATPYPADVFLAVGPGSEIVINSVQLRSGGLTSGNCIRARDGASLRLLSINIKGFAEGIFIENVGSAVSINASSVLFDDNTHDFRVDQPTAMGCIIGCSAEAKVTKIFSSPIAVQLLDQLTGNLLQSGNVQLQQFGDGFVDVTTLFTESATMGFLEGGELTPGSGFTVNIAAGVGYLETEPEIFTKVVWGNTSHTFPANSENYLYFDNTSTLVANPSFPDTHLVVLLGRVVTNGTGIDFIDSTGVDAEHTSNHFDETFRDGIGAIYSTGSIVSESGTRNLDVSQGKFYVSTVKYLPTGGAGITWVGYYRDGSGGWVRVSQTQVDNAFYDDGSGTLQPIPVGRWAKHSLYVVGDGVNEKYFLVYSQQTFTALTLAEQGSVPTPPGAFKEGVALIASIIVKQGFANIVEIRDERPVIGFKSSGVAAATVHGNLLGLLADDHPQYLRTDGARAMTGNLDVGTHAIQNVTTVNGVAVEAHEARHLPNGADPLTTAAPTSDLTAITANGVGVANSLARSDHSHAIDTGSAISQFPDQANATGTSANLSRADHIHNIATAAPISSLSAITSNAQGIGSAFSRNDHGHAILTGTPATQTPDQANAVGVSANLARADHIHAIPTAVPVTISTANAQGSASTFARSDHVHAHGSIPGGATHDAVTTLVNGYMSAADKVKLDASGILTSSAPVNVTKSAAVIGVSTEAARADHKHDIDTATASSLTPDLANAEGAATSLSRSDHIHNIATAVVVTIGTANAQGSALTFAKSDHVHAHGAQTDGTLHAVATISVNGFMSAADKVKLNGIGGSRIIKSGFVSGASFAGNPKKVTITFGTAFPDTNYSIAITGANGRTFTYESKLAASFVINANANTALAGEVSWTAISTGETVE